MHLSHDYGTALASHVSRADAVLHAIARVGVLLHYADAPTCQRDVESAITEAVVLAAK